MSSYDLRRGWGFRGAIIACAVAVAGLAATAARPAAQASIPSTPDTPFKLATFEAQGKTRLGIVLGTRVLDIDAASKDLVGRAKVPAVAIPADMRTLIEQYGTVSPRLYQIANYRWITGCARPSTKRWSGASCSASPTPAPTPPA